MRTSFYIDCSPGSLGIPEYVAGVPSWAPPTKCPLNPNPSLADGGAVRNCRSHQEECRRIHKALEKKSLQPSVMFCPLQDMVYLHYNDGDAWERSVVTVSPFPFRGFVEIRKVNCGEIACNHQEIDARDVRIFPTVKSLEDASILRVAIRVLYREKLRYRHRFDVFVETPWQPFPLSSCCRSSLQALQVLHL